MTMFQRRAKWVLQKHYLRHKMMEEIQKLRKQVGNIVENMIMSADGLQLEQK